MPPTAGSARCFACVFRAESCMDDCVAEWRFWRVRSSGSVFEEGDQLVGDSLRVRHPAKVTGTVDIYDAGAR